MRFVRAGCSPENHRTLQRPRMFVHEIAVPAGDIAPQTDRPYDNARALSETTR